MCSLNAFLAYMPMVMDRNVLFGNMVLPVVLRLLRYIAFPFVKDPRSLKSVQYKLDSQLPNYSIGLLNSHARHAWINTILVVLYKYNFNVNNDSHNTAELVKHLVKIVMNTLECQWHKCTATGFEPFAAALDRNKRQSLTFGIIWHFELIFDSAFK